MSKKTVSIEIEIPEGFEATGEYRDPDPGEPWAARHKIFGTASVLYGPDPAGGHRAVILRPKPRVPKVGEVWRFEDRYFLITPTWPNGFTNCVELTQQARAGVIGNCDAHFFAFPSLREWALSQKSGDAGR